LGEMPTVEPWEFGLEGEEKTGGGLLKICPRKKKMGRVDRQRGINRGNEKTALLEGKGGDKVPEVEVGRREKAGSPKKSGGR